MNGRYISLILAVQIGKWPPGQARSGSRRLSARPGAPRGLTGPRPPGRAEKPANPQGWGHRFLGTRASRVGFSRLQTFSRKCEWPAISGGGFLPPYFPPKAHVRFCFFFSGLVCSGAMHWPLRYCKVLYFEESKGECRNKIARPLELESLCAESKDIPGLRLLHLELCHSPTTPTPPSYPSCSVCTGHADWLGGKLRVIGNPRVHILMCLLRRLNSAKYMWI